jgi:hypothetical protein
VKPLLQVEDIYIEARAAFVKEVVDSVWYLLQGGNLWSFSKLIEHQPSLSGLYLHSDLPLHAVLLYL